MNGKVQCFNYMLGLHFDTYVCIKPICATFYTNMCTEFLKAISAQLTGFKLVETLPGVQGCLHCVSKKSGNFAKCLTYALSQVTGLPRHRRRQLGGGAFPVFA